jgi:hypothetical protein
MKKKTKMTRSPTALTLQWLEENGYIADIVERRITPLIKKDLFGFIDIVAVEADIGFTLGIQVTTRHNISARVNKILEHEDLVRKIDKAGWIVHVWGWYRKDDLYLCNIREVYCGKAKLIVRNLPPIRLDVNPKPEEVSP